MNNIILLVGIGYFLLINAITFFTYGWDKRKAVKNQWRIPEATLILLGFLGGAIGAIIGRKVWHHKTQKIKFKICVPISLVVTILLMVLFAYFVFMSNGYKGQTDAKNAMKDAKKISMDGDYIFEAEDATCGLILYPGAMVDCKAYAPIAQALSEKGITCIVVSVPGNIALLDQDATADVIAQYPDIKDWYVGGHSLGGVAASNYVSSCNDTKIKGMVFLASYSTKDFHDSDLKVLSVYGSEDQVLNKDSYEENKSNLPTSLQEYVISGGNHAQFGDYGLQKGDGQATILPQEQWKKTVDDIAGFMN